MVTQGVIIPKFMHLRISTSLDHILCKVIGKRRMTIEGKKELYSFTIFTHSHVRHNLVMPELPEVEANRRAFLQAVGLPDESLSCSGSGSSSCRRGKKNATCKRTSMVTTISMVKTSEPFDDIVCEGLTAIELQNALLGASVVAVKRKGKQLWAETSHGLSLLLHFGMTGALVIENEDVPQYKAFKVTLVTWPPRFTKLELGFSNGARMAYCDPRRLGRIRLRAGDPLGSPPLQTLALDPYTEGDFEVAYLRNSLQCTNAPIKSVLLEQERVFSGIGNYLADEVLYQSHIHPKIPASCLNEEQVHRLANTIRYVIKTAVNLHCAGQDFPEDWLFHYRWDKGKRGGGKTGGKDDCKLPDGRKVTFENVGGRTSAVVLQVQKFTKMRTDSMKRKMAEERNLDENCVRESKIEALVSVEMKTRGMEPGQKKKRTASTRSRQKIANSTDSTKSSASEAEIKVSSKKKRKS